MIRSFPVDLLMALCLLLICNIGTSTTTIQNEYTPTFSESVSSSVSEHSSQTTVVFQSTQASITNTPSIWPSSVSTNSVGVTHTIATYLTTPMSSTSDKTSSSITSTNNPSSAIASNITDASSDLTLDTSSVSTNSYTSMEPSFTASSFPSQVGILSESVVTSVPILQTADSIFVASATPYLMPSEPGESLLLNDTGRASMPMSHSIASSTTSSMITTHFFTTDAPETVLHTPVLDSTLSTGYMSDMPDVRQINSTSQSLPTFETTSVYESTSDYVNESITQQVDQSTTESVYLVDESTMFTSDSISQIPISSSVESSFTESYTSSAMQESTSSYTHLSTAPIMHVTSIPTATGILETATDVISASLHTSVAPSPVIDSSTPLSDTSTWYINTSLVSLETSYRTSLVSELTSTYILESTTALISTLAITDHTYASPSTTAIVPSNTTSMPTAKTVTAITPTIGLDTIELLISFKQNCGRIKKTPQLQMEFLESLVAVLETTSSDITDGNIHFENLDCKPFTVEIHLTNVSRDIVMASLDKSIANSTFIVPILENGRLVEYKAQKATLLSHTDKDTQDTDPAIEDTEIVIIAIASFLFMVLMFFGSVLICRECYLRKRAASFNLLDVPHVDLKLTDFTLTRIPRPHMIYFEPGSKKSRHRNGHDKRFGVCKYGTDLTEAERPSVTADQLHLRVHDHDDGLVIGVTCTTPPHSPTHESTSGSSSPRSESLDPSTQMLIKNGGPTRGRKGTENPNYTADDEQEDVCGVDVDDDSNEQIIML